MAEPTPLAPIALDGAGVLALAEVREPVLLPRSVPPKRLVADWNAEEPFAPEGVPAEDVVLDGEEELLLLEEVLVAGVFGVVEPDVVEALVSRNLSLRLPRSCGVTSETKFSAAVAPVSRTVFSTGPARTLAVRVPAVAVVMLGAGAVRLCQTSAAAAIMTTASTKPIQIPALEGLFGRGGMISGRGAGAAGLTDGAEATFIGYLYIRSL